MSWPDENSDRKGTPKTWRSHRPGQVRVRLPLKDNLSYGPKLRTTVWAWPGTWEYLSRGYAAWEPCVVIYASDNRFSRMFYVSHGSTIKPYPRPLSLVRAVDDAARECLAAFEAEQRLGLMERDDFDVMTMK